MAIEFLKENSPEKFDNPIMLPTSDPLRQKWQSLNKAWWERHPMRYDFTEPMPYEEFTEPFYREIDRRFFSSIRQVLPWRDHPFESLVDFHALRNKDVLEIGVGCGSNAEMLSKYAKTFNGIDITEYASGASAKRFALFGLNGQIHQMDAEHLKFPDQSFDFVWSWGVIHCSANTDRALDEIYRVLRPGGRALVMVYHRSAWNTLVRGGLYYGLLRGELFRRRSLHRVVQDATDGALARYYTCDEWNAGLGDRFQVEKTVVLGHKSQFIPLPWGPLKFKVMAVFPDALARVLANNRMVGYHLVSVFSKK